MNKYKVGDRVEIIDSGVRTFGKIGEITDIDEYRNLYLIKFQKVKAWYSANQIKPAPKYQTTTLTDGPDWLPRNKAVKCWVSDIAPESKGRTQYIVWYHKDYESKFMSKDGYTYKYATPIPEEPPATITINSTESYTVTPDKLDKVREMLKDGEE